MHECNQYVTNIHIIDCSNQQFSSLSGQFSCFSYFLETWGVDFSLASTWHNCLDICYFNLFGSVSHTDLAGALSQKLAGSQQECYQKPQSKAIKKTTSTPSTFVYETIRPLGKITLPISFLLRFHPSATTGPPSVGPKNSLPQRQLHPESWQQPWIFDAWNMWQKNFHDTSPSVPEPKLLKKKQSMCTRIYQNGWGPLDLNTPQKKHNKQKHSNNLPLKQQTKTKNQKPKRDVCEWFTWWELEGVASSFSSSISCRAHGQTHPLAEE